MDPFTDNTQVLIGCFRHRLYCSLWGHLHVTASAPLTACRVHCFLYPFSPTAKMPSTAPAPLPCRVNGPSLTCSSSVGRCPDTWRCRWPWWRYGCTEPRTPPYCVTSVSPNARPSWCYWCSPTGTDAPWGPYPSSAHPGILKSSLITLLLSCFEKVIFSVHCLSSLLFTRRGGGVKEVWGWGWGSNFLRYLPPPPGYPEAPPSVSG